MKEDQTVGEDIDRRRTDEAELKAEQAGRMEGRRKTMVFLVEELMMTANR